MEFAGKHANERVALLVEHFSQGAKACRWQRRYCSNSLVNKTEDTSLSMVLTLASFSASGICLSASLEKSLSGLRIRPSDIGFSDNNEQSKELEYSKFVERVWLSESKQLRVLGLRTESYWNSNTRIRACILSSNPNPKSADSG